jgi:hypothetical protein
MVSALGSRRGEALLDCVHSGETLGAGVLLWNGIHRVTKTARSHAVVEIRVDEGRDGKCQALRCARFLGMSLRVGVAREIAAYDLGRCKRKLQ